MAAGIAGAANPPGGGAGNGGSATEGTDFDCARTVEEHSKMPAAICHQRGLRRDGILALQITNPTSPPLSSEADV
jgi:hypothetical protein